MDLEKRLDELYAAAPEDFTGLRNELVAELAQAGDKKEAAKVKRLKKPVVAAWLLNQLALTHTGEVNELLELGDPPSDQPGLDLRGQMARRRALVADLVHRAKEIADDRGVGAGPALSELSQTLLFVANSPDRELFAGGRLAKPPAAAADSAFGLIAGDAPADKESGEDDKLRRSRRKADDLQDKARAAEAEWSEANAAAEAAAREAEAAARRAEEAQKEAAAARRRADSARARADQAAGDVDELGG
ncbi:MAG: hypothetical protein M3285_08695 [Actinomycetota bacterium]|nr:hypothetical protein [Actinomycetota bacterium]